MVLVGPQYEPVSLDVSKACFKKEQDNLIHVKNQGKAKCYWMV